MLKSAAKLFVFFTTIIFSSFSEQSYSRAQVDSTYIGSFGQRYSVQIYTGSNFTNLLHEIGNKETIYMPNAPYAVGLGLSWGKSSIGFGYGFPFMRDKAKGDTKTNMLSFQYRYYGRKFIADLFFQDYKGLYTEDEDKEDVYYFFPDIHVTQYGAVWQYIFSGKKLSYRAAFNQTEKQLKSAGSFHLGGGTFYSRLKAESTFDLNEQNRINNIQIGMNGGYGYTWVINKHVYMSGSLSVGVNIGKEYMDKFNFKDLDAYPTIYPRVAFGYDHDTWSLRLSAMNNLTRISHTQKENMSFMTGTIQLTFIRRFGDIPVLSKYLH